MKYYIIHFDSITQFGITNSGYFVSYQDKISDKFSPNYIDAKKYKSLGPVLTRAGISFNSYGAFETIKKIKYDLDNSVLVNRRKKIYKLENKEFSIDFDKDIEKINILPDHISIEILEINGNDLEYLGPISNKEIYEFIKKESDKFCKKYNYKEPVPEKNATQEDIDDFCSHMDNLKR